MSAPLRRVLERLPKARRSGDGWVARCPAHEDQHASLSVGVGRDGRAILYCHAGCNLESIVSAMQLAVAELFPPRDVLPLPARREAPARQVAALYDYSDEDGALLYQVVRYEPKDFRQRRPDGRGGWEWRLDGVRRVLYRLPELLEAIAAERRIYLVEGEKDADRLWALGLAATTNVGGAGKWDPSYSATLAGAHVVVCPDNDAPGREHAVKVADALRGVAADVRIAELPGLAPKGDVSDWLDAGGTVDELERLVADAGAPPVARRTRWTLRELLGDEEIMRPPKPLVPYLAWIGRATSFASREKLGKSTLLGQAAARVSDGGEFLGELCERGVVLIFGFEEFVGDLARRLQRFNADPDAIHIVDKVPETRDTRIDEIRRHIMEIRPTLVIVDSLIAYAGDLVKSFNDSAQVGPIIQGLTNLAHEEGLALVIIHHGRKEDGSTRDSTAIPAGVDIVAEMFAPTGQDATLREVRIRGRVPTRDVVIRFDGHRYNLAEPPIVLEDLVEHKIWEFVDTRPGASKKQLRNANLGASATKIDAAIERLVSTGRLRDLGGLKGHAYHAVHDRDPVSQVDSGPDNPLLSTGPDPLSAETPPRQGPDTDTDTPFSVPRPVGGAWSSPLRGDHGPNPRTSAVSDPGTAENTAV